MAKVVEEKVPDIGDFQDVEVIEVLINPGDHVQKEDSLITLESDKATMEVPASQAGVIKEVKVSVGDKINKGDTIVSLETEAGEAAAKPAEEKAAPQPGAAPQQPVQSQPAGEIPQDVDIQAEVVVLGSGPGGYTAAFRAADLGKKVVLVERYPNLGGVCLNVGCIPSKALLHVAEIINEADAMAAHGVSFGQPKVDKDKLLDWKMKVVRKLTDGLGGLAKRRKVTVVQGTGSFAGPHELKVEGPDGTKRIGFEHAIIAAGSQATKLPHFPHEDPRVLDSTDALELPGYGGEMLLVGGGIIGLEMATVYNALGTKITVAELGGQLMPGADPDLVKSFQKFIKKRYENIYLNTQVTKIEPQKSGLKVWFEGKDAPESKKFDYVLVAIGRQPNGHKIGAENAGVNVDERGFIKVDKQQRTNVPHIFAIGDIVGQPMLAHKATHEGKVAAEVSAGHKSAFDARVIPSVAYTDPEVAWAGVTEQQAKEQGLNYGKGSFPWGASGRSLSLGRDEGATKLLFDKDTNQIIGVGMVGPRAGELIAEACLAIEMGADAEDIGLTVHPHPTLSETVAFAAEAFEGTITDLYIPKRR